MVKGIDGVGIHGRDLLYRTYETLKESHWIVNIDLRKDNVGVKAPIIPPKHLFPSDSPIIVAGLFDTFMYYDEAAILNLDGKCWALANGSAEMGRQALPYGNDIIAFPYDPHLKLMKIIRQELRKTIEESHDFANSLVFSSVDSYLCPPTTGRFADMAMKIKGIDDFILQQPRYSENSPLFQPSGGPLAVKSVLYKLRGVDFLVETIEDVLRRS